MLNFDDIADAVSDSAEMRGPDDRTYMIVFKDRTTGKTSVGTIYRKAHVTAAEFNAFCQQKADTAGASIVDVEEITVAGGGQ